MRFWIILVCAAALLLSVAPPARSQELQGALAAHSGANFEAELEQDFRDRDVRVIAMRDWNESEYHHNPALRAVITDAPYDIIYGGLAHIEFLLILGNRQILIEAKRQESSGSVDEKLPYVFANARHNWPAREYVFVMDGDGWREGAETWIRARDAETEGFTVLRREQFPAWLDATLAR